MLVVLPLLGLVLAGVSIDPYLQFPPDTRFIDHKPFSWAAFLGCALFLLAAAIPVVWQWLRSGVFGGWSVNCRPFPWWGWVGLVMGASGWILAWTRMPWVSPLQPHTFTPLWFSYILVINALTYARRGHCMMINRPAFFAALFPASALFWWFFEYLNRFVQNWHYVGADFAAWEYFWYATLPFSTVLPAVLGTRDLIAGNDKFRRVFGSLWVIRPRRSRCLACIALTVSAAGLAAIGLWPNYLFPLLWISPLLIVVSLQHLMGEPHVFRDLIDGDWRLLISSATAALICGFFWEMWNYCSLAKWQYSIPLVDRYRVFEMPIVGYGGYLPFGVLCTVIGSMITRIDPSTRKSVSAPTYKNSP
jgi:hypothetical protein